MGEGCKVTAILVGTVGYLFWRKGTFLARYLKNGVLALITYVLMVVLLLRARSL